VTTSNLDPKLAATLAYVLGPVSGVVFLAVEKTNDFVRFHAMQSVVTFLSAAVVDMLLRNLPLFRWMGSRPFLLAVVILWIFLMIKAFSGERYKVPYLGDVAERLLGSPPR
jgi:uncharacterized membrane protein